MGQTPNWQPAPQTTMANTSGPMFYLVNGGNPGVHMHKGSDWQPGSVSDIERLSGEDEYLAESNMSLEWEPKDGQMWHKTIL